MDLGLFVLGWPIWCRGARESAFRRKKIKKKKSADKRAASVGDEEATRETDEWVLHVSS
jgi:hypothetical protein